MDIPRRIGQAVRRVCWAYNTKKIRPRQGHTEKVFGGGETQPLRAAHGAPLAMREPARGHGNVANVGMLPMANVANYQWEDARHATGDMRGDITTFRLALVACRQRLSHVACRLSPHFPAAKMAAFPVRRSRGSATLPCRGGARRPAEPRTAMERRPYQRLAEDGSPHRGRGAGGNAVAREPTREASRCLRLRKPCHRALDCAAIDCRD